MASYQNVPPKDSPAPRREMDGESRQLNSWFGVDILRALYSFQALWLGVPRYDTANAVIPVTTNKLPTM